MSVLRTIGRQFLLIVVSAISIVPLAFMIISALKTREDYAVNKLGLPHVWTIENFREAFVGRNFVLLIGNSVLLTVVAVAASTFVSAMAAYAFATMRFRFKTALFNITLALMVVPPIVMVVPLYRLMNKAHMVNTYFAPLTIYVGLLLPFTIYLLVSFIRTIPRSILESARIDGCSTFNILLRIVMPLTKPAVVTAAVVNAIWVWNELLIVLLFLQKESARTLMVGVAFQASIYNVNVPVVMAGLTIATVPLLILYIVSQRSLIRGLTAGSVKG